MNKKLMKSGVELILQGMGVDLNDSNFKDTPMRVAKMYAEMLTPQENNWRSFPSPTKGMITLRGHPVFAICPHHLMPVELKACVGYVPRDKHGKVLGLSKLARVVESFLTKPIMQEELGENVVEALYEETNALGAAVVLSGSHGCMRYRGIETTGDVVSSHLRGLFMHSEQTRNEFLSIIGRP